MLRRYRANTSRPVKIQAEAIRDVRDAVPFSLYQPPRLMLPPSPTPPPRRPPRRRH